MDMGWAMGVLERYGLLGIFAVLTMEYACFPLPSEVLLPVSGLAAAAAGIPLALVVGVSVLAGVLGSSVCYTLGFLGGRPLVDKLLDRFPRARRGLAKTEQWQAETGGMSVMLARVIPIFRTWISFVSGFMRQPYGTFALYSGIGIIIWNTVLLGSGYYLYTSGLATRVSDRLWILPIAGLGVASAVMLWRRKGRRKKKAPTLDASQPAADEPIARASGQTAV